MTKPLYLIALALFLLVRTQTDNIDDAVIQIGIEVVLVFLLAGTLYLTIIENVKGE